MARKQVDTMQTKYLHKQKHLRQQEQQNFLMQYLHTMTL